MSVGEWQRGLFKYAGGHLGKRQIRGAAEKEAGRALSAGSQPRMT